MKKFLFFALVSIRIFFSTDAFAQANDFKIYTFPGCWGGEAKQYLMADKAFEFITIFTQGTIVAQNSSDTVLSVNTVKRNLSKRYPDPNSTDILLLDWEGKIFTNLRKSNPGSARFKYSESQYLKLIKTVKTIRPNLKIGIYGLPFKFFSANQKKIFTQPSGKLRTILAQVDVITPSLYLAYPDEEITPARNKRFLQENLDVALAYGKELNKPVIPLVWHRVHPSNRSYSKALLQPEVFGAYVKFIAQYSHQDYQVSGVMWWDDMKTKPRMRNVRGLNNWTQGKITDNVAYNSAMIEYAQALLQALKM